MKIAIKKSRFPQVHYSADKEDTQKVDLREGETLKIKRREPYCKEECSMDVAFISKSSLAR